MNDVERAALGAALAIFLLAPGSAGATPDPASQPSPQAGPFQQVVPFDGVWAGTIVIDKEALLVASSTPAEGLPMRIEIHDAVVRVFIKEGDAFVEVKPGLFHIAPVEANAVIFATEASYTAGWVESWAFVVTQKDDHTLIVEYSRLVNNVGAPSSDPDSKFGTRGVGEFVRLPEKAH
jgi:hypothetical protein